MSRVFIYLILKIDRSEVRHVILVFCMVQFQSRYSTLQFYKIGSCGKIVSLSQR